MGVITMTCTKNIATDITAITASVAPSAKPAAPHIVCASSTSPNSTNRHTMENTHMASTARNIGNIELLRSCLGLASDSLPVRKCLSIAEVKSDADTICNADTKTTGHRYCHESPKSMRKVSFTDT